jgi:RNA polymerase sigma-70 factor (ECF subfamily)
MAALTLFGADACAAAIAAARQGNDEMLGRLLESCRDYLLLVAARGLDADLAAKCGASDLVQETLFGACRDFGAFRGTTRDELLAWLQKILLNRLAVFRRSYRKTLKRSIALESRIGPHVDAVERAPWPYESATPGTHAVQAEIAAALHAALERLPSDYQRVVIWYQYDRLTFEQIGQRLDRSAEAARKLWSRALLRLAAALGPAHDPKF